MVEIYYSHIRDPQFLFSDVISTLTNLEKNNFRLGIFSESSDVKFQLQKLALENIYKYFDKDLIFIFPKKLEYLDKIPKGCAIVDDNESIVSELIKNNFSAYIIDRENEPLSDNSIQSLSELRSKILPDIKK